MVCILKEYVQELFEAKRDIMRIAVKVQVILMHKRSLEDVIIDIRGIEDVATVKQVGTAIKTSTNKEIVNLVVAFNDIASRGISELLTDIKAIKSVDIIKLVAVDGKAVKPIVL